MFHLEALGRDFAKWAYLVQKDLGGWVSPLLENEYNRLLDEAKDNGVEIPDAKRMLVKKKRLATVTAKTEFKLKSGDYESTPRIPIELDEEGQRLQQEYDMARQKLKVAQKTANIITEEEVRMIAQLAQDVKTKQQEMENSERRKEGEPATEKEMEYGVALDLFIEYTNDLKERANKRTLKEQLKFYNENRLQVFTDIAGTLKSAKASLDNSFHFRQGLPTFLKGITGDAASMKAWWNTFTKSWKIMWDTLKKRKALQALFAEMVSDPDYDLLKRSKVAIFAIEEEIPVDIPSKIPLIGMLFKMGENAFVGASHYARYQIAKQYIKVWRKSGIELTKKELEAIGRLTNSQTGRGEIASNAKHPGLLNNLFWSPRNLRAYVDILTAHVVDRNMTSKARRVAAMNLLRYISGAAMILALANWIDDDSVTDDPTNADFGKIRIGNTRFAVGGGMAPLVVLAFRLARRQFTSSTTGETKSIDTGKFGSLTGRDLVFSFFENKLSPASQLVLSLINQSTRDGEKLTVPQLTSDALTPLILQNILESGDVEDSANIIAVLMAEALGVNVQSYEAKEKKPKREKIGF